MTFLKNLCTCLFKILYFLNIILIFSTSIWELYIIYYYRNTYFILAYEQEGYNFTAVCSILNIIYYLFLFWLYNNNFEIDVIYNFIILILIKVCIGIWTIILYNNLITFNKFFNVIVVEFYMIIIQLCIVLFTMFILYNNNNNNNNNKERLLDHDTINV